MLKVPKMVDSSSGIEAECFPKENINEIDS